MHLDFHMSLRTVITVGLLMLSLGCGRLRPVIDTGEKPDVGGSISGIVTTDDKATPLSARKVTAVNVETGARFDISTSTEGGYTVRVPQGKYRLEVELRPGEKVSSEPGTIDIRRGDLDSHRDVVVVIQH